MKVLVTGAAGFIGFHVARRLAETGRCEVLGVDNLSPYYDVELKRARLAELGRIEGFRFLQADFADEANFASLLAGFRPEYVVHLGAQPGVRHSAENPGAYVRSNLVGFASVLEACRKSPPKHLVYASSSSVYGAGARPPFREDDDTGQPVSFYGATKRSNELMAHSYARVHGLKVTGLRFFTVYGPWGRPDMAPTLFSRAICDGKALPLFNGGKNLRDFTYIDDAADAVLRVLLHPFAPAAGQPPARIFNLGHNRAVETLLFVRMLEELLGARARIEWLPAQPGDMVETCADLTGLREAIRFTPRIPLEEGLRRFVAWFKGYYRAAVAGVSAPPP
jgi:UDP-glucuronate 4-epimerase